MKSIPVYAGDTVGKILLRAIEEPISLTESMVTVAFIIGQMVGEKTLPEKAGSWATGDILEAESVEELRRLIKEHTK